jgi:dTDP-4-amino-4,6-dideoxygalactose transaminase
LGKPGFAENVAGASAAAKVLLPKDFSGEGIWNQFTLRVLHGKRDALKAWLAERKIGSEVYYPLTLDRQECFRGIGRGTDGLAVSHRLSEEVLSIPVFPEMTEAQRNAVAEALAEFARN